MVIHTVILLLFPPPSPIPQVYNAGPPSNTTSLLTATKVLKAAEILGVPVYVTTQNRARLGDTVPELKAHLPDTLVKAQADKTLFSMWVPEIARHFDAKGPSGPSTIAILGIESHICVTQTALDLLAAGHQVRVIADGVSSCNREEVPVALDRLRAAGAVVTTSESWIYERTHDAGVAEFRSIVGLIKDTSADTKTVLQGLLPAKM